MQKEVGCDGAWAAKRAERFGFALSRLWRDGLHFFVSRQKVEKTEQKINDKSKEDTVRCPFAKLRINSSSPA